MFLRRFEPALDGFDFRSRSLDASLGFLLEDVKDVDRSRELDGINRSAHVG
jgi:hypothetical protein